jgi:hypothetical protein
MKNLIKLPFIAIAIAITTVACDPAKETTIDVDSTKVDSTSVVADSTKKDNTVTIPADTAKKDSVKK